MGLGSGVAAAVALASGCSSDLTLAWEFPYAVGVALKKNYVNSLLEILQWFSFESEQNWILFFQSEKKNSPYSGLRGLK